jgi:hypothetical protein
MKPIEETRLTSEMEFRQVKRTLDLCRVRNSRETEQNSQNSAPTELEEEEDESR